MQLFADTADTGLLTELMQTGMIDGVTTNPTIIAKSGRDMIEVIKEISDICPGPISAEVVSSDARGMVQEGKRLNAIASNIVVKVPLTKEGLIATGIFTSEGIKTNVTLCFSVAQALLTAKAGATFVSPFVGRLEDQGADGVALIRDIRLLYDTFGFKTMVLAASVRHARNVADVALAGADCATLPPSTFSDLYKHPLTDRGLEIFMSDWKSTGQSIV